MKVQVPEFLGRVVGAVNVTVPAVLVVPILSGAVRPHWLARAVGDVVLHLPVRATPERTALFLVSLTVMVNAQVTCKDSMHGQWTQCQRVINTFRSNRSNWGST